MSDTSKQTECDEIESERVLQDLICGRGDPAERRAILKRLTGDEGLRRLLAEMIRTRELARAAFGYPADDTEIPAWSPAGQAADGPDADDTDGPAGATDRQAAAAQPGGRRRRLRPRWRRAIWRVAGGAVVAASVLLALDVHRTNEVLRQQISQQGVQGQPVFALRVDPAELRNLRNVWSEIAGDEESGSARPWILLSGQNGQFGYVESDKVRSGESHPIVVRVLLVSAEGQVLEKSNLLLPGRRSGRLSLADAGKLGDLPIGLEIDAAGATTRVGLTVGQNGRQAAGISGRVQLGNDAEEIGRLRVDGKDLRVIVQAVPLNGPVS